MESVLEPLKEFSKNSVRLVKRCTKPDRKGMLQINLIFFEGLMWVFFLLWYSSSYHHTTEIAGALHTEFNKICLQTALGFIVMGFIGFFVKLVFIVSILQTLTSCSYTDCVLQHLSNDIVLLSSISSLTTSGMICRH
jgi:protein transport protein SEC61 subunit gamma-like protein